MEWVDGKPLSAFIKDGLVSADLFVRVERALITSWLLGVLHLDAHGGNIMVTKGSRVVLIDFGFAMLIPRTTASRLKRMVDSRLAAKMLFDTFWYDTRIGLQVMANTVQAKRSYDGYNPDGKLLRYLYTALHTMERRKVILLRTKWWSRC